MSAASSDGWIFFQQDWGIGYSKRFSNYYVFWFLLAEELPIPAALYPLNGLHGTRDISPNKNPPGIPNGARFAPGPFGNPQGSYRFSGSFSSYIEIPNNGGLDTRCSITILAWINRENENGPIVNYGTDVWGFHFWIVNGGLYARPSKRALESLQCADTPYKLSKNWHYVGTSYNFSSGIVRLWINGSEVAQAISGSEEQSTQYNVRMGAKDSTTDPRYLKGRICCLQIYNKSLSQQEIIAVQNRTLNTCEFGVSGLSLSWLLVFLNPLRCLW